MIAALLLAVLAQAPDAGRPGENDAPVLIDLAGHQLPLDGGVLPPGTACLTYDKAASLRDDLADKNARADSAEATLKKGDPQVLKIVLFTAAGFLAGGAVTAGVVCGTGHCR